MTNREKAEKLEAHRRFRCVKWMLGRPKLHRPNGDYFLFTAVELAAFVESELRLLSEAEAK